MSASDDFQKFQGTPGYIASGPARRRRELRDRPRAAAADQGRAGHRQDAARAPRRRGSRPRRSSPGTSSRPRRRSDGLYVYDTVQRLNDARFGDGDVATSARYIRLGAARPRLRRRASAHVLLIDEIDKADLEFPNDLLRELDEMRFTVPETGDEVVAQAAADGDHHLEQREGAAGRVPAPLRLPLHRVPGPRADAADRRRAPPEPRRRRCSTRCWSSSTGCASRASCARSRRPRELIDWIAALLRAGISQRAARGPHPVRRRAAEDRAGQRGARQLPRARRQAADALERPGPAVQPVGRRRRRRRVPRLLLRAPRGRRPRRHAGVAGCCMTALEKGLHGSSLRALLPPRARLPGEERGLLRRLRPRLRQASSRASRARSTSTDELLEWLRDPKNFEELTRRSSARCSSGSRATS